MLDRYDSIAELLTLTHPQIHLAHDWLVGLRGGERVLDRLAAIYGPTVLYTLVNDGNALTPAIDACRVVTSGLQRMPGASGKLRRLYFPVMAWAVDQMQVEKCDVLISTSSAVMKSIAPPAGVPHLCYCHSPARYIWGQTDDYGFGSGGNVRKVGLRAMTNRFRKWDRERCTNVTKFLTNSLHTARKIERCYDREAEVVYPPVDIDFFTLDEAAEREDFFLIVSALEPYKRVDLAVEAANRAKLPLRVVGRGSQLHLLQDLAGPTVEVLGYVDREHLRTLFRRAKALIHPQQEDFGITAVEAQACGCPVIAYRKGGALETVTSETGTFFAEQTIGSLLDAVVGFESRGSFSASNCRANVERFGVNVFDMRIQAHVQTLLGVTTPTVA